MFFKKKKEMIDVRELQKRGVVRLPKKDIVVPTNRDGFIEFGSNSNSTTSQPTTHDSELRTFSPQLHNSTTNMDSGLTDLDNKIYKLEQRIELLEKKLDISKPSENSVGVMGW